MYRNMIGWSAIIVGVVGLLSTTTTINDEEENLRGSKNYHYSSMVVWEGGDDDQKNGPSLERSILEYAIGGDGQQPLIGQSCTKQMIFRINDVGPSFGVFVGVTRSKEQSLDEWPYDIHGSIGHWDVNFKKMSAIDLCENAFRVGRSAVQSDNRRSYFPLPLQSDPNALLDIKFMRLPLRRLSGVDGRFLDNNGEPFNNRTLGLIVL